jgi:cation diffusion facilitator family transporter
MAGMSPSRRAALVSLAAAIFLVAIKLTVGLATGSLGVVAEAVHSAADSFAALLTLYAVTVAERPADRSHQYGHGKAQNLGALAETLLLVGAAVWIGVTAIGRFSGHASGPHSAGIGIALMLFVLTVDASRALIARRTARAEHSAALYANSWHFATDFAGSLAVLVGLVLAASGYPKGDAIAALVVAAIVMIVAITLAVRNVESLMDFAPRGLDQRIREAALTVPGVEEVRSVRVRESGGEVFADVIIGVPRLRGIERSHETTDAVEQAVESAVEQTSGRTSVTVHVEPTALGERDAERVAAAALRVPGVMEVHNIAVLADGSRREVTMHARVAEDETLGGVEDTLSMLRAEISHDLEAGDVHIHLEPFAPEAQVAHEVTEAESELSALATRAAELAAGAPCLVELWRQDRRLVAVCALEADPSISVRAAHVLAGHVEDAVREAVPVLADVIVEVSARTSART